MDPRLEFVLNCVKQLLRLDQQPDSLYHNQLLNEFINGSELSSIRVTNSPAKGLIVSQIDGNNQQKNSVYITKMSSENITEKNVHEILSIQNMPLSDPLSNLHQQVKNLFLPSFQQDQSFDNNLMRIIDNLKEGLDNVYLQKLGQQSDNECILNEIEEFNYWNKIQQTTDPREASKSLYFSEHFSKISKQWQNIQNLDLQSVKDVTEQAVDVLDRVWVYIESGQLYSEQRMRKLIDSMTNTIISRVQNEFKSGEIWDASVASVKPRILECYKILKNWQEKNNENCGMIWPKEKHTWRGPPVDLRFLENFMKRLQEIEKIQSQQFELLKIEGLNKGIQKLDFKKLFQPFLQINCLHVNQYTENQWVKAQKQFEKLMEPVDEQVVNYLRNSVFGPMIDQNVSSLQIIKEMNKWQGFLAKQSIIKGMHSEREMMLDGLIAACIRLKDEFESRSGLTLDTDGAIDSIPASRSCHGVVNQIVWAKQLSGKFKKMQIQAQQTLSDMSKLDSLKQLSDDMINQIKDYEQDAFDQWQSDILHKIETQQIVVNVDGKLMELDIDDGLMKVNYSDRLVQLIREKYINNNFQLQLLKVRQLCEQNFKRLINKKILDTVDAAQKYYKEAVALKQIANFYNTMSTEIIESQRPMILQQAIDFENVVKEFNVGRSLNSNQELEQYISKVKQSANLIMQENKKLRKVHLTLIDLVNNLFDVDLLKQKPVWKEKIDHIRKVIDQITEYRNPKLCRPWRSHWDVQISKVLEYQFRKGLLNLNQTMPEIHCELVFEAKMIKFNPSIEELKQKYYKEVKQFVIYPAQQFQGVGGNQDIYKELGSKNQSVLLHVYKKAEELFQKLSDLQQQFVPWSCVAFLNVNNIQLKNLDDWEYNINQLRLKRREIERLPDDHKIDCFKIDVSSFKNSADEILARVIDSITQALKSSLKTDCNEVDEFVDASMIQLTNKPKNMQEILETQEQYMLMKDKTQDILKLLEKAEVKNQLLRNLAGQTFNIANTQARWENFLFAIGDFDSVLQEQQEQMKGQLIHIANQLQEELQRFHIRWTELRPKKLDEFDKETAIDTAASMKNWRTDWDELQHKIESNKKDHQFFGLSYDQHPLQQQMKNELQEEESGWKLFADFIDQLKLLEQQDWISFRPKLHQFQDFTSQWIVNMKNQTRRDAVTLYLEKQLEKFKTIYSGLKLLIGDAFEKEHWRYAFTLLKLSKTVTIENLLFGDLLNSEDMIIEKLNDLKELSARAQGEVSLREAVFELRNWLDTYEFDLTQYTSVGRTTPLIKEWKDLMTKVSENQSLLASLKESKYFQRFQEQIEQFENKLGGLDEILSKLNIIQRKWVYLEPIFQRVNYTITNNL